MTRIHTNLALESSVGRVTSRGASAGLKFELESERLNDLSVFRSKICNQRCEGTYLLSFGLRLPRSSFAKAGHSSEMRHLSFGPSCLIIWQSARIWFSSCAAVTVMRKRADPFATLG